MLHTSDAIFDANQKKYTWVLDNELRNVAAVRPLRITYNRPDSEVGGALMNLNDYRNITVAKKDDNYDIFYSVLNGTEVHQAPATNVYEDPYTHVLRPAQRRLSKFEMMLYEIGTLQLIENASVALLLSVYCLEVDNVDMGGI